MTATTKRALADLVAAVVHGREDREVVAPILRTMLDTTVKDFDRYCDARYARSRVVDHDILTGWRRAQRAKDRARTAETAHRQR